jgi:hypothetical protein
MGDQTLGTEDRASRFNMDMKRILESRNAILASSNTTSLSAFSPMERRKRPKLLTEDIDGTIKVMSMLRQMIQLGVATEASFQIVLEALCGRGRLRWKNKHSRVVCAADEVDTLMDELWERQNGNISTYTYDLALRVYAACSTPRGDRNYAQKAQDLLDTMEEEDVNPSIDTFRHVINAWAWQQGNLEQGKCAEMSQSNLERLMEMDPDDETLLQALDWVLEAWSKSSSENSPERAEDILTKMKKIKKKNPSCRSALPNSQSYTNTILAWAKSRSQNSAQRAHNMLYQFLDDYENGDLPPDTEPELFAFNGVISSWARIGRTDKAEEVLWKANKVGSKCKSLVPNVVSYNSVIHSYGKEKDEIYALDKTLEIFDYMQKNSNDQPAIRPDCFTHHCVLKAFLKVNRSDAINGAAEALKTMHELWETGDKSLKPSNIYYNMAINQVAKNAKNADARKALEIFYLLQASRFCNPDIISYTSVIECLSKSVHPKADELSLELFNEAWRLYLEREDPSMMPNLRTYSMAILSLTKYPTLDNVIKARELLTQLDNLYQRHKNPDLKPNAYPYNYVLNCAASCVGDAGELLKAFHVAMQTYSDLRKSSYTEPDSYTYSFWIKAANKLLPEGDLRRKCISLSFEQCRKDGLVNEVVLKRLLAGTPIDVLVDILGFEKSPSAYRKVTINDFPPSWR